VSAGHKALVALGTILMFAVLTFVGWSAHKTGTGAFMGAMIAGAIFEFAQRWDRRTRATRRPARPPGETGRNRMAGR
jgi:hypothetical protein